MKKTLATLFTVFLSTLFLFAGGSKESSDRNPPSIKIVTTIFPVYDWTARILDGVENISVSMLVDSGADLHNFQPTVSDMMALSSCNLFIYIGGESDGWVPEALKSTGNEKRVAVNLMEILGGSVIEEDAENSDDIEYDEHIWLSLKNASILVKTISDVAKSLLPDYSVLISGNTDEYLGKIRELDAAYEKAVSQARVSTLLFGDRFPFAYLCRDYNLNHYAAFSGCSAETEASFEKIVFLAGKVDELGLDTILKIEGSKTRIPETIRENTRNRNQQILTMDSMQSIIADDINAGKTYLSIMEGNLETLRKALP